MYNICILQTNVNVELWENISYICLALFFALLINYSKVKNQATVGKNEKAEMMFNTKSKRKKIEVRTEFDHHSKIYNPQSGRDY